MVLGPRNRHVSTFTEDSLSIISKRENMYLYGSPSISAMSSLTPSWHYQLALSKLGEPRFIIILFAPAQENTEAIFDENDWHTVERNGDQLFRWTRMTRIKWKIPKLRIFLYRLRIVIPVISEIQSGYGESCRIQIGEKTIPNHYSAYIIRNRT